MSDTLSIHEQHLVGEYRRLELVACETFMRDLPGGGRRGQYTQSELQERIRTIAYMEHLNVMQQSHGGAYF